jgi:hypothetical protein
MKKYRLSTLPKEPGLYQSGSQVWELDDDGMWNEIHGDGAEFGDYDLVPLVPATAIRGRRTMSIEALTGELGEVVE